MAIFQKLKFPYRFTALFCASFALANIQSVAADKSPEVLQLKWPCPVAEAFDSNHMPVYFWQHTFADGVQDLAMARVRTGEALDAKRVTFGGSVAPGCHYKTLAIARGGNWGWHLLWLAEGSPVLRYARMDGDAWVSSPTKKLSANAHPVTQPAILSFDQQLWVVWYESNAGINKIYAVFSDDEGRSWGDVKLVAETVNPPGDLQLLLKGNKPYLIGQGIAEGIALQ